MTILIASLHDLIDVAADGGGTLILPVGEYVIHPPMDLRRLHLRGTSDVGETSATGTTEGRERAIEFLMDQWPEEYWRNPEPALSRVKFIIDQIIGILEGRSSG